MDRRDECVVYRGVWKAFDLPVLQGVSLTVRRGETLAVVGPSGTGKSVLLKTTIGLLTPERGQVWVGGTPVVGASDAVLKHVRSRVGYVFQNAALFDSMTVLENVLQGFQPPVLERLTRRERARPRCGRRALHRRSDRAPGGRSDPVRGLAGRIPAERGSAGGRVSGWERRGHTTRGA